MDRETVAESWMEHGSKLAVDLTTFDGIVDRLYEASTNEGESTYVSSEERRWIVETALTRIDTPENPLFTEDSPTVGLIEQAEELLSLLEFAGLNTPEAVVERLNEVGLDDLVEPLSTFVEEVHFVRENSLKQRKSFRSERYAHVILNGDELCSAVLSATDVVIVGAFQTLSPLERDLIDTLASTYDTAVVCARVTDSEVPSGVDRALARVHTWYESLGFEPPERSDDSSTAVESTSTDVARRLYRFGSPSPSERTTELDVESLSYPTVRHETSGIAREIRSLIAEGVDPDEICVAVYDSDTYAERIGQALDAADVPVNYDLPRPFFATTTGKLFEAALDLGTEPNRQEPLCRLLANPLVNPSDDGSVSEIIREARRLESTRIEALQSHLDSPADEIVEAVATSCERFAERSDHGRARAALFESLGVPIDTSGLELDDEFPFSERERARETSALTLSAQVCDSLASMDGENDAEGLRRALEQVTVENTVGRASGSVRVCSPTEAAWNPYSHVFIPGLTTDHTPSPARRLAFTRRLNESHVDFQSADPVRQARYTFGLLLASDAQLHLSRPERNANGDPYVPADVLKELQRVSDTETESRERYVAPPASREDVHRSLAEALETGGINYDQIDADADAFDIEIPEADVTSRLRRGVKLASARARAEVGKFDGRVTSEVVRELRERNAPFSPSRLETYAGCGFKFYMNSVLDIDADEEITIEANALDAGNYVHDVLETFYREWIAAGHRSVTDATLSEAQAVLYDVAVERLDDLDANPTVFHGTWIESLFDGLEVEGNAHGDPDGPAGLFRRFLDAEVALSATRAQPTYFEAHVGIDADDPDANVISPDPIQLPGSSVSLHGKIDRIDVTADGGLVAYDYKTGSTPSTGDTLDGYAFQLTAYLLMAEEALDGEAVGASYYQVDPDSSISYWAGTIGAEDDASYYRHETEDPLRRYRTLEFESREEFHAFLREEVSDRIERVATAVREGTFIPTILGPDSAGCEYCDYRDACDVRHHRRHEIHETIIDDGVPNYIPTAGVNEQ
ncbi:PD-(D/E)XK nuclease family protein [Natronobacterium haloterrestre]|uniref:PD-(D/E)XK nuclease family protein n=1 Tax=Natronobacterium haloterrestre TaxID=148448 RepID=UPI0015A61D2F|nr:PD-(D/E)XK nuclease family protein [Halobiforma haloterrestris]